MVARPWASAGVEFATKALVKPTTSALARRRVRNGMVCMSMAVRSYLWQRPFFYRLAARRMPLRDPFISQRFYMHRHAWCCRGPGCCRGRGRVASSSLGDTVDDRGGPPYSKGAAWSMLTLGSSQKKDHEQALPPHGMHAMMCANELQRSTPPHHCHCHCCQHSRRTAVEAVANKVNRVPRQSERQMPNQYTDAK